VDGLQLVELEIFVVGLLGDLSNGAHKMPPVNEFSIYYTICPGKKQMETI
jgi:hypothetical protein